MKISNIRNADLNLLVAFDALFDERNVTRAANRLALTQPTVSGMLKRLRALFEDDLFVRTSHGIVPTPRAEALAVSVKELLASAQSLLAPEEFDPTEAEFTARLCGSDYLQQTILSAFTDEILKRAPNARVSVLPRPSSNVTDMLARGEFDLSVSIRTVAIPELPARTLYHDRYVCLSSYKETRYGQFMSLEQLCTCRHAFVDPTGGSFRGPIDEELHRLGFERQVVLAVPTFATLMRLMEANSLMAFMPERIAKSIKHGFALIETPLETARIEVVANWHPRMNKDARHIWLRETLASVANTAA
jgi:DNA-binding transcriptional LysR family regulator